MGSLPQTSAPQPWLIVRRGPHRLDRVHFMSSTSGTWRMVGAVENSELLVALADALERQSPPSGADEAVDAFHRFRAEMGGPAFDVPEPDDELEEALLERALEHPRTLPPRRLNVLGELGSMMRQTMAADHTT